MCCKTLSRVESHNMHGHKFNPLTKDLKKLYLVFAKNQYKLIRVGMKINLS